MYKILNMTAQEARVLTEIKEKQDEGREVPSILNTIEVAAKNGKNYVFIRWPKYWETSTKDKILKLGYTIEEDTHNIASIKISW